MQEAPPAELFFADGKSPCGAGNPAYGRLKNQRKPSIAVDNRANMRIMENKNKNSSYFGGAQSHVVIVGL